MNDVAVPMDQKTARRLGVRARQGQGTLLLYPDRLVHVASKAAYWAGLIGLVAVTVVSFALAGGGPGALGVLIGFGGGTFVGSAIAKRRAPAKASTAGDGVTVIPLSAITGLNVQKSKVLGGMFGGRTLVVATAGGEHRFSGTLEKWSSDVARALAGARGAVAQDLPERH